MCDEQGGKDYTECNYPHSKLTRQIIGGAMTVHSTLGPGYLERIYEKALAEELSRREIKVQRQVRYPVLYRDILVGEHILDLVVESNVYVELKAATIGDLEVAQVLSGLKASRLRIGLLINFSEVHLRDSIRRIILPKEYLT